MTAAEPPASQDPDASGGDDERYNLAARIYGGGGAGQTTPDTPRKSSANGDEAAEYNLAARVYGGDALRDAHGGVAGAAPSRGAESGAEERYNLAARVYGNGSNGHAADVAADVPAPAGNGASPVAEASSPPARRGGPPAVAAAAVEERGRRRFSLRTFQSLQVPAFRWYLLASLGSFGAMNMQILVSGYLVFTLTGSFAALGTVALARAVPGMLLTVFGGVVADRLPKKRVIQTGQTASALLALAVGLLLYIDRLEFWHLLASSATQGAIFALMMPSRQSMTPEIVGMDRMMNAVALNMGGMNFMRLFAPAGGGVLLATVGADFVYFLMAGLYLFSVVTLSKVSTVAAAAGRAGAAGMPSSAARGEGGRRAGRARAGGGLRDVVEGFRYVGRNRIILLLLSSNLLIVLVSMPYQMMLPGYVLDVLKGGPQTLGLLSSVSAIGALSGTLVIASLPNRRRGKLLLFGSLLMGVALVAFSFSTVVLFTALTMIVIGVGQTFRMSLSNVLVQTYVDDAFRGRVMSLNMMQMNVASLGVFGAGMLAAVIGPQLTIGGMAVVLIVLVVLLYAFVPRLRNLD